MSIQGRCGVPRSDILALKGASLVIVRRVQHLGWLTWLVICIFALFLATSVLAVISMFFPYIPSREVSFFCYYILPLILFSLLIGIGLVGNILAKRGVGYSKTPRDNWVGPIFSGAILSILWSLMMSVAPAIPTKYFAHDVINVRVVVSKVSGFRINYGHFVWIYYEQDGFSGKVMWTRTELVDSMKSGDCISLHGRKWLFGFYVDSISKSSECAG